MGFYRIEASIAPGQRLASGTSVRDPVFNQEGGTIKMQAPAFRARGLDLDAYFAPGGYYHGTLNVMLAPRVWERGPNEAFAFYVPNLRWTDKMDRPGAPPFVETFYLDPCEIVFQGRAYKGLVYIPDPLTKPAGHAALAPYIDVIAEPIAGIGYGDRVEFAFNPAAIVIKS